MATGRGPAATRPTPAPGAAADAPRRPSMALQPFAWGGLQILPVAPAAAECVAVVPPPLPGLHHTAPFRVSEYHTRCRLAVAALEAALGLAEPQPKGGDEEPQRVDGDSLHPDLEWDDDLRADLDLSDLRVPLPPGISATFQIADPDPGPGPGFRIQHDSRDPGPSGAATVAGSFTAAVTTAVPSDSVAARAPPPPPPPPGATTAEAVCQAGPAGAAHAVEAVAAEADEGAKVHTGAGSSVDTAYGLGLDGVGGGQPTAVDEQQNYMADISQQQQQQPSASDSRAAGRPRADVAGPKHSPPGQGPGGPVADATDEQQQGQQPEQGRQVLEQHQAQEQVGVDAGREVKRRRVAPARYLDLPLPPPSRRPRGAAAADAATAGAIVVKTEEQQPAPSPQQQEQLKTQEQQQQQQEQQGAAEQQVQRALQEGGRRGKAKTKPQQLQVVGPPRASSASPTAANATAVGDVSGGRHGAGRGVPRVRQEQQAASWWEGLTAAAEQLESLRAVLQAPPMQQLGDGEEARQEGGQAQGQQAGAGEEVEPGRPQLDRDEELRALEEELAAGERARQRMLTGEADEPCDDDGGGGGRAARRRCTVTAAAAAGKAVAVGAGAGGGAYGPAAGVDEEMQGEADGGGPTGRRRRLPAPAEAAMERIRQSVIGPHAASHVPHQQGGPADPAAATLTQLPGDGELVDETLKDEVVVWVAVFGPGQPQVLHEEFLVLGSNCLSELRDVLGCATEDAMRQAAEVAAAPPPPPEPPADVPPPAAAAAGRGHGRSRGRGSRVTAAVAPSPEAPAAAAGGGGGRGPGGRRAGRGRGRGRGGGDDAAAAQSPSHDPGPAALRAAAAAEQARHAAGGPLLGGYAANGVAGGGDAVAGPSEAGATLGVTSDVAGGPGGGDARTLGATVATAGATSPNPPPSPSPSPPPPASGGAGGSGLLPPSYGSYLYLEGRFFTDVRHPEAEDYTAPIRELCSAHGVRPAGLRPERGWRPGFVRDHGGGVPPPGPMHLTRFADLTLRQANHPTGIFCHRACCEHLLLVRDVRRWHPGDPPHRGSFPLRLRARDRAGVPVSRRRCGVCEARFAELVTHDDPLAPSNPAIMCRHCFDLLHIGSNGERIAPTVVVQPYNPALDIVTQGTWAAPAGAWTPASAAAGVGVGGGAAGGGVGSDGDGGGGGEKRPWGSRAAGSRR